MKPKDKKAKESTIGKIIYGFLLFMPLMAIFVKCGYTMFNKNAYQSYDSVTETQATNIDTNTYNPQTIYNFKYKSPSTQNSSVVGFSYISLTASDLGISQETYDTLNTWTLRANNQVFFGDGTTYNLVQKNLTLDIFKNFNFMGEKLINLFDVFDVTFVNIIQGKLSNVFYYSVNQVTENPLFNWTQNTFIYTGVQTFTNALNINNVFFPLLLSYWMILSVVYIIYDLGLMMIQIVHRKVHELGDSI